MLMAGGLPFLRQTPLKESDDLELTHQRLIDMRQTVVAPSADTLG